MIAVDLSGANTVFGIKSQDVCRYHFKCKDCQEYINLLKHKKENHKCGEEFCKTCQEYVMPNDHQCYWKKLDLPVIEEHPKYILDIY